MMKVTSKDKYNTSFGQCFVLDGEIDVKVGEKILINNMTYTIKKIILPTRPGIKNITIFV